MSDGRPYDNGGILPARTVPVTNGTGRPEPVFTDDQWAKLQAASQAAPPE